MKKNGGNSEKNIWLGKQPEKIYEALLTEIRAGQLRPGARVPTEKELCGRFHVCRNTVRRALGQLTAEQWLVHRAGVGCMVASTPSITTAVRQSHRSDTVSFMYHGPRETIVWLQNLLLDRGYLLGLFSQREQGWDSRLEALFLRQVREQRHRALLASCTPAEPTNALLLADLSAAGVRVIHVEPYSSDTLPTESFIMPDYKRAGYAAAAALLLRGYDPILYVGDPKSPSPFHVLQERGFLEAQRELLGWSGERRLFKGATSERANFIGAQWLKQSSGRTLLRALRNRKPGFLCATQEFAVQLIKLLRQEGVAVPDEAGLVGPELISDQMPTETLAQVRFPRQELLERAVEHAIAEDYHEIRELVPPSLIVGATLAVLDSGKQRKTCSQK